MDGPGKTGSIYSLKKGKRKKNKKVLLNLFKGRICGYTKRRKGSLIFLDSSMVEHTAVNRGVVGSSPTRGAKMMNII